MNWLGAVILVASAYFCGIGIAKNEGEQLKALDSLIKLLDFMRRRMSAERIPLYSVFASFSDSYLEVSDFLPLMRSCRNSPADLWQKGIMALPIEGDARTELLHLGESLGTLPLDQQLKRIDSCVSVLNISRNSLREALPKRQKSIKTVSLLIGALTAIILL